MEIIIAAIVIIVVITAALVVFILHSQKSKEIKELGQSDSRADLLREKLALIYAESTPNFALYSEAGERKLLVMNGVKCDNQFVSGGILCNNLFENPILTTEFQEKLHHEKSIDCKLDTSENIYSNLNTGNNAIYHVTIKEIENQEYKYMVILLDITTNIENIQEKEKFRALVEFATIRSSVGIAYYNIRRRNITATKSWYKNLGPNLPPKIKESIETYLQSVVNGNRNSFTIDFETQTPTGTTWIREHIFIHTITDKDNIEVIDLNMDITNLKESENILIVLNKQVMETKKESDKFLNSISHEVRTPLNSIVGFSNLFVNTSNTEEKKKFEEIIHTNINQLIELVNNIILIARIDAHTIRLIEEPIPINQMLKTLLEESVQMLKEDKAYADKNIILTANLPQNENYITTDKKLFVQVFANLLSNALKFTQNGTVTIGYTKENSLYRFCVTDTGIGIAPENMEKLFDRFEKINTFTQGTGLGLPLCKSILQTIGGEISVKSILHQGTEFSFTLPEKL
ncbi:MAG: HAMP domain-containing sensor histidine kinase [Bacteroidales bacterium]